MNDTYVIQTHQLVINNAGAVNIRDDTLSCFRDGNLGNCESGPVAARNECKNVLLRLFDRLAVNLTRECLHLVVDRPDAL